MGLNMTKEVEESPSATPKDKQTKPAEEAAKPTLEEEGSSSIEPRWGRIESSKEKERMEDLRLWESINIGGYTNQRTTKAYRHGQCYMCDPEIELFCKECDKRLNRAGLWAQVKGASRYADKERIGESRER
jgi:hypothetical protein